MTVASIKASPFAAELMGMEFAGRLSAIVSGIGIERAAAVALDRRQLGFDLDQVSASTSVLSSARSW